MLLNKLSMSEVLMLASILEKDNSWKRVAGHFHIDPAIHLKKPSAFNLLVNMIDKHISVENLYYVLDTLKLEEAAKLICKPEMLRIVRQPYCDETESCFWDKNGVLRVMAGKTLHLKIEAEGSPMPTFQWYRENVPVCSEQEYTIPAFSEEEGVYHCTVHQREDYGWVNTITSDDITVKLIDVQQGVPQITPSGGTEHELECGDELRLTVLVSAAPHPTIGWWHNAKPLEGFKSNVLRIPYVDEKCKGTYECRVKNRYGENKVTYEIKVIPRRPNPSEKRALLIGIENYGTQRLSTPHNDAKVLKECLEKYDFNCTLKQNLPANSIKEEVRKFFATLQENAFVLFFFGGHGFMEDNVLYMIGSDVIFSPKMKIEHVVSENFVIDAVQQYKPLMFISILDMCQTKTECDNFPKVASVTWDCTLFRCYSTSQNRSAFEGKGWENSLYVKTLKDALLGERDLTFNQLITKVSQSVTHQAPDHQRPEVRSTLIHDFKLSDPIQEYGRGILQ